MAADVCSELLPSLVSSPRLSFSHDPNNIDNVPIQDCQNRSPDFHFDFSFNFCNEKRFTQEICPADELFSDGKILPIEIKMPNLKQKQIQIQNSETAPSHHNPCSSISTDIKTNVNEDTKIKKLKEFLCSSFELEEEKPFSKIFRQFRRSTSLNVESGRAKGYIRPLLFLSRSNSTGSALDPKPNVISNTSRKENSFKQSPTRLSRSTSSSSSAYYAYNSSKRPPLKKNPRACSNGVRITPVLHISHSCMAFGSVSIFSFGSLFCSRKTKKKKK